MKRFLLFVSIILFLFCCVSMAKAQGIMVNEPTGAISACQGTASESPAIAQIIVLGTGLTADILVTAPNDFEVSLSPGSGFATSVNLPASGGTIYVRSAATAVPAIPPNISGNVTFVSGVVSVKQPVTGIINALPTVDAVPNQPAVTNGTSTTSVHFTGTGNYFKWVNDKPGIGLPASGTGDIASFDAINTGSSPIVTTITVTPYFDGFAYIADVQLGGVWVINTLTDAVATTIPSIGSGPDNISVSPDGSRVYVSDVGSHNVQVISTATNAVIATINLSDSPYGIVVSPDGSRAYVANLTASYVSVINTANNTLLTNIPMPFPTINIAISPDGKSVYASNDATPGAVAVISTATNSVVSTIGVDNQPSGLAVIPDGSMVYVANYSAGDVSVISTATKSVVATISVGLNPTGVTVSPDGKLVYVAVENTNSVAVISTATNTLSSQITVGGQPFGVSVTPDGKKLYVVNDGTHNVSVVDIATGQVTTITTGAGPLGLQSIGNFITDGGCSGVPTTFTITVNPTPPPTITATGSPAPLTTIYGTASASTSFTVSGTTISSGILVTPPPGFEVSTDGINYTSTVTIGATAAVGYNISPVTVYIRLTSTTPADSYMGSVKLTSTGAAETDVEMPVSTVNPASLTVTADNKSRNYGEANPVLTVTYSGFVNNDGPAQLTVQPVITTTAIITSPAGQYPITAGGAASSNYTFTYDPGVLTIDPPQMIIIPNVFTPNGDGVNDAWDIKNIDVYPNCSVEIYNRWGENVYSSIGYGIPWEGTYKGSVLPSGTYYYIINLKNGLKVLSGFVAIIR